MYGYIAPGIASQSKVAGTTGTNGKTPTSKFSGVRNFGSNWGIKGSSEVSEGLTAVYKYETSIDSTGGASGIRYGYAGLSGGFGTITVGQSNSASKVHINSAVDKSSWSGNATLSTSGREPNLVSYSVAAGSFSFQADAKMDASMKDKSVDAYEVAGTVGGLMETGSIHFAHIKPADSAGSIVPSEATGNASGMNDSSTNVVAFQYGIGGLKVHLGYAVDKTKNNGCKEAETACMTKQSSTSVLFGAGGSVGDTGVTYGFNMTKNKVKSTDNAGGETGNMTKTVSRTPWVFALNRSLGGGASVHFEHANSDKVIDPTVTEGDGAGDKESGWTAVWLSIAF